MGKSLIIKGADFSENAILNLSIPVISVNSGVVTITCDGATSIYYTIDGTTPSTESTLYSETFEVQNNTTIKAIGYDVDGNESPIASYTYIQHSYITTFEKKAAGSGLYRAVYTQNIPTGKKLGFVNSEFWNSCKMAVSLTGTFPTTPTQWDTSYSGESYIQQNITLTSQIVQILIAPVDGSSITDSQIAELNSNIFYIDD